MVIYADMLFLLNALINWVLLDGTARFAGRASTQLRMLPAAGLGGVYALACALPVFGWLGGWAGKLCCAVLMLALAFGWGRHLLRLGLWFGILSAAFAGVVLAVNSLSGGAVYAVGGTAVYPVSFPVLVLTAGGCYAVLGVLLQRFGARSAVTDLRPATLCIAGRLCRVTALLDNGNLLRDPMDGKSVCVLDPAAAGQLFPELREIDLRQAAAAFSCCTAFLPGARLVPYAAVGSSGLLLATKCDWLLLGTQKYTGVTVAFSPTPLSGGTYQLIAGGIAYE